MPVMTPFRSAVVVALFGAAIAQSASALPHRFATLTTRDAEGFGPADPFGRGGRGRGQGGRGFGTQPDVKLRDQFDANKDGQLDPDERRAARLQAEQLGLNRGRGGRGAAWFGPIEPGPRLDPSRVRQYRGTSFYDPGTLRTIFLTFANAEWEQELMAFKRTDVNVPATMLIDGATFKDVGVQFHGNSSFSGVPIGLKHSMRIALDAVHDKQDVDSYNTLLLLNAHEDPSFLRTVLTLQIARDYFPAPKANFVRVVINGESWGIYANQQQFNKDLTRELFKSTEGARWKVPGNPGAARGGLNYLGDDIAPYKSAYEIKTKDDAASWAALVHLTRVLSQTPPDQLEFALGPLLDVDGALRFLAVDNALVNSDGYWTRASDYSLYMEPTGRFHVLPYDVNTTFVIGGGRGGFGRGGGRGGSVDLHPLQAAEDFSKPLAARLLAVPAFRERYLGYVRDIATKWLDWRRLGPIVAKHHALIDADVRTDPKKLESYEDFLASVDAFKDFAERRRAYLLGVTAPTR